MNKEKKKKLRLRRHRRARKKIFGTAKRPRFNVYRSPRNIYVQIINDEEARTCVSGSTLDKEFKKKLKYGGNIKAAQLLGKVIAERALKKGIKEIIFDRGGYLYHGRVKALAEGARESGLKF
jgi:large subunit ribosomal protein L18